MVTQPTKTGLLTLQPLMQIELFLASLVPTTGILIVLAFGTRWIMPAFLVPFLALSLVCAIAIFLAEFAFIFLMQRILKEQFSDLVVVCQTYLAGNRQVRAIIQGDTELTAALARVLNALLDFVAAQEQYYLAQKATYETYDEPLKKRVQRFIATIAPSLSDNLREQTEKAAGDPGVIIDTCGYIAQECIQYMKSGRAAAKQIAITTREAIGSSIDVAQASETLMLDFARTSERVEKLVAFMQRLGSMLQLYLDNVEEASQVSLVKQDDSTFVALASQAPEEKEALFQDSQPDQAVADDPQSMQLLQETIASLQEQTLIAEAVIEELYAFAQGMHQANTGMLKMVEQISSLVNLAEQWSNSGAIFQLSEEDSRNPLSVHI
jgi:hypothetical protein